MLAMGNLFGKNEDHTPDMAVPQRPTKHVKLLVLHNRSESPNMEKFRRALIACPPPSSIAVDEIKQVKIPEAMNHQDITQWVHEHLNQNGVVLICLLADYDIQFLLNRNEVIPFCFQQPHIQVECPNCVEVDFDTATQEQIKTKLVRLAALIRGGGR